MKVLSAEKIRKADAYTIANEPIESFKLMERASAKCAEWIKSNIDAGKSFIVFCGPGNNGGDGLCIARLLKLSGRNAEVFLIQGENQSEDFKKALNAATESGVKIREYDQKNSFPHDKNVVLVDAIFGTGMNRKVEGLPSFCIQAINNSGMEIISIDMPSGMIADMQTDGPVVNATHTLTFQSPKLAFLLPGSGNSAGNFHVLDIGLSQDVINSFTDAARYVTKNDVAAILRPRSKFSHKGDFGKALLIAGSHGKMGAAVLAAKSCLRSGAGLLTVHVPASGYEIIQTCIPEAMCVTDANEKEITRTGDISNYDAIGVGPGIGTSAETTVMLSNLLDSLNHPCVLDADALNIISADKNLLKKLNNRCILTPHPGEFERLAGPVKDSFSRYRQQREFSDKHNVVVVLKGAHTCITIPGGKTYFNSTGNPAMAKGGTGDALTGVILGLLSQGYSAENASVMGVYLHGLAGDLAAVEKGPYSMLCTDLIERIPDAFRLPVG